MVTFPQQAGGRHCAQGHTTGWERRPEKKRKKERKLIILNHFEHGKRSNPCRASRHLHSISEGSN